jgi:hypothetical protein
LVLEVKRFKRFKRFKEKGTEEHRRPSFADVDDLVDLQTGEEQITLAADEGELEFWDKIMRSPRQPMQRRMKAAELGAQYKYAKLGAIAVGSMNGKDFASMLERAIERTTEPNLSKPK